MKTSTLLKFIISLFMLGVLISCGGAENRKISYFNKGKEYLQQGNLDKAKIEFKNVLQIDPEFIDAYYYIAKVDEKKREYRKALSGYKKAVELQADHIESLTGAGRIYLLAGVPDKAIEFAGKALQVKADYPEALAVRAAAVFYQGDIESALKDVRSALDVDPDNLSSIALLSRIYITQERVDKAETLLVTALRRKADDISLRVLIVQFYQTIKQFDKAAKIMTELVAGDKENIQYRIQLALFYNALKDTDKAEEVLRTAVKDLPDSMLAKRTLIDFLAKNRDLMFAQLELSHFIKADKNNPELKLVSALLYKQTKDNKKAENIYREIIRKYGNEAAGIKAQYQLVLLLLEEKREDEAKSELANLLKEKPSFIEALSLRGILSLQANDAAAAIADFREIIKEQPKSVRHIKLLAEAYIKEGNFNLAEQQLKRVLDFQPKDVAARMVLAKLLHQQKQYSDAIEQLNILEKLKPESVEVKDILFKTYLAERNYAQAMQLADKLQKEYPGNSSGYFYSGLVLQAQKKYSLSMQKFEKALKIKADLIEPLSSYVRSALALKQPQLAEKKLKQVIEKSPDNAIALNLLGEVLLQQKKNKKAAKIFMQAITLSDKWWIPYRNLASTQLLLKQTDKAIKTYRDGITKALDKSRLYLQLAMLLESQGEVKEAMTLYEEMLQTEDKSKVVLNNMALLLVDYYDDQASKDRALSLVDQFQTSTNPNFLDTLGWVHYKRGEYERALSALLQADGLAPDQVLIQYHLGSVYFSKGDMQQARQLLEPLVKLNQSFKGKKDVQRMLSAMDNA